MVNHEGTEVKRTNNVEMDKSEIRVCGAYSIFMYAVESNLVPIGANTNMYRYGYDKFSFGIGEIFAKLKPLLAKYYGIKFNCLDWDIMNKWQSSFKDAGYEIIQAL